MSACLSLNSNPVAFYLYSHSLKVPNRLYTYIAKMKSDTFTSVTNKNTTNVAR